MQCRAAILERDPALQLLRIVEAYQAIQRRIESVGNNSNEIPKLASAIKALDACGSVTRKPRLDGPTAAAGHHLFEKRVRGEGRGKLQFDP